MNCTIKYRTLYTTLPLHSSHHVTLKCSAAQCKCSENSLLQEAMRLHIFGVQDHRQTNTRHTWTEKRRENEVKYMGKIMGLHALLQGQLYHFQYFQGKMHWLPINEETITHSQRYIKHCFSTTTAKKKIFEFNCQFNNAVTCDEYIVRTVTDR
jgi:hypothetical protein